MGIIFDPEEMIRKYEAGVPFEELVKRPKLPEGMIALGHAARLTIKVRP